MNKSLLILISALFILLAVSTVYYQIKVQKVVNEYHQKSKSLEEITGNILQEKTKETAQVKETSSKDKGVLESGYAELKTENENLRSERDELKSELNTAKSDLEQEKGNFNYVDRRDYIEDYSSPLPSNILLR